MLTFEETKQIIVSLIKCTTPEIEKSYVDEMVMCYKDYSKLSFEERKDKNKVIPITNREEIATTKYFNILNVASKLYAQYKFVWSNSCDGWNTFKDLKDGDIYIVEVKTGAIVAYLDLKTATEVNYNTKFGTYIGGEVNVSSISNFLTPYHYYLLSSYDGKIFTLIDTKELAEKLELNKIVSKRTKEIKPCPSKFGNNDYYTIYHHFSKVCKLNKDVFVIKNKSRYDVTCFN